MSDCMKYKVLSVIEKINWLCEGKDINEYSSVMVDLKDVNYLMEYIKMLEHKLENKEDKEIDIQAIEEVEIEYEADRNPITGSVSVKLKDINKKNVIEKINELIKAIKQLDNKIK